MELSERKNKILASVVERYIVTGEPVGSKILCGSLAVSSATIRNEMSELSAIGFLEQPHTSAGRIPSQKGLRYYVDRLMTSYVIGDSERMAIESRFDNASGEPNEILSQAVSILSDITGFAAVASTPYDVNAVIKRVELVPLSSHTALIVLLASTGVIKSKVLRCDSEIDISVAELFYNIAGAHFLGRAAGELSLAGIQTLAASLGDKAFTMTPLLVGLSELSHEASRSHVVQEGQSKLLNFSELEGDVYGILELMKHSAPLQRIINSGREALNIRIGRENMTRVLENAGIIFSKYIVGGREVGAIGIIGPVRMDYARVIPNVVFLSEIVGAVLSESIDE